MRIVVFLVIVLCVFFPFNWLTYRQLVRLHPRRRHWVIAGLVAGNLMWPFLPILRMLSPLSRAMRATLTPVWFGWTYFALMYSVVTALLLIVWLPFRRRARFEEFARRPSRVFLWLILIGSIVGFYQAIVPLRVERVTIKLEHLPRELVGTRIALMGDLHVGFFTRPSRLRTIFQTTDSLYPSLVILAGDLIDDDPYYVPKLLAGARALSPATPLFAVLGNHEMYGNPNAVIDQLRGSRIRLLVNEGIPYGGLWVAGISDYASGTLGKALVPDMGKALAAKPAGAIPIVVSHQPRSFTESRQRGIPLTLCAHTHGGQCGFRPFRWSLAGIFLPFHMGLYQREQSQLYVNTGTGYWCLPFRLGMTPEITLIELRGSD